LDREDRGGVCGAGKVQQFWVPKILTGNMGGGSMNTEKRTKLAKRIGITTGH